MGQPPFQSVPTWVVPAGDDPLMGHCPDDTAGRDAGSDFHLIPTISSPQTSKARRFPSPRRPNRVGKGSRDRPSASLATSDPSWCDGRPKGGPNRRCRSGKMGPSERQRPIDGPHSRWAAGLSGCWPWGRRIVRASGRGGRRRRAGPGTHQQKRKAAHRAANHNFICSRRRRRSGPQSPAGTGACRSRPAGPEPQPGPEPHPGRGHRAGPETSGRA